MPTPRKDVMMANKEKMLTAANTTLLPPSNINTSPTEAIEDPGGSDPRIRTSQMMYITSGMVVPAHTHEYSQIYTGWNKLHFKLTAFNQARTEAIADSNQICGSPITRAFRVADAEPKYDAREGIMLWNVNATTMIGIVRSTADQLK